MILEVITIGLIAFLGIYLWMELASLRTMIALNKVLIRQAISLLKLIDTKLEFPNKKVTIDVINKKETQEAEAQNMLTRTIQEFAKNTPHSLSVIEHIVDTMKNADLPIKTINFLLWPIINYASSYNFSIYDSAKKFIEIAKTK